MQDHLRKFADHPLVGEVRGVGLLAGVEVMADGPNRVPFEPTAKVGPKIQAICEDNGLLSDGTIENEEIECFSCGLIGSSS